MTEITEVDADRKRSLSVASILFFLLFAMLLLLPGSSLLQDPDTFWHIKIGEWILEHLQFPTVDIYSYTAFGKPYISTEWLSQILLALAFKFGGWRLVVILAALSCAAVIGLVSFYLLRHLRLSVAVGWAALTAAVVSPHFIARPHVFSYVVLVIWMIKLLDYYDSDEFNLASLVTLVPLMVLWANLHGSFTFGLVMLYIFAGFSIFRNWNVYRDAINWHTVAVIGIVSLSALVTPYGFKSALTTSELIELKYANLQIIELRPPDFQAYPMHLMFFLVILCASVGLGIRLRGARLIAFALIMFTGLSYSRGLIMFFILAPLILAWPASKCASLITTNQGQFSGNANDPILRFLYTKNYQIPVACMAVSVLVIASTFLRKDFAPTKQIAPQEAIAHVRQANIAGNVFNAYVFGGYLIFSGIPTFVDGRSLPFGDNFLRDYFDAVSLVDIRKSFELLDKYHVAWTLLRPTQPLAKALFVDSRWDKVYSDRYAVVFRRHID